MKLVSLFTLLFGGFATARSMKKSKGKGGGGGGYFEGYYMGIDPVDGGDSRSSIYMDDDGTYHVLRRDTYISLCDGTDAATLEGSGMVDKETGNLVIDGEISCILTDAPTVGVQLVYKIRDDGVLVEDLYANGNYVASIVFWKVNIM